MTGKKSGKTPLANREKLTKELTKENPDWRKVEALGRELVDSDPDNVRFSVDAGHIRRLGEQLVGKQETAVSELIKNAYDADATKVSLSFRNHTTKGGVLVIEDDGNGMIDNVIRSAWMRISTDSKQLEPISPRFGRLRAGQKGIGRFAVQRLGARLVLTTMPIGDEFGFKVTFDWDADFKSGSNLQDVYSRIERFEKQPDEHGTKLVIADLRDAWSKKAIENVWRSVILLQPPFEIARSQNKNLPDDEGDSDSQASPADPGFLVGIDGVSQSDQQKLFSIEKSFLDHALAEIDASIDETGTATVRVSSKKLGFSEEETCSRKFLTTGPLNLSARYFIYVSELMSGINLRVAADMGRKFGGVRVYRNGFRVSPYGGPRDDWLSLEEDVGRRNLLVAASNRNFFGSVHLSAKVNPLFEETSSREGLLESDVFVELREFVRWALEWAAVRIAAVRSRKTTAGQRNFISEVRKPSELIREFRKTKAKSGEDGGGQEEILTRLETSALEFEQKAAENEDASLRYEEMLRILASLGLSISVFGHEVKGSQTAFSSNIELMSEAMDEISNNAEREMVSEQLEHLSGAADRLFDIGGYIAGLMSSTESRELRDLSVKGAIERFAKQFNSYMAKQNVKFEIDVKPAQLRTTPMHSSEFDSVLLNFLTNSIKSIRKAKASTRKVRIEGRRIGNQVVIAFEDNGVGIPENLRERVFDPFFTTTLNVEDDGVAGPGAGLGLKIVSDIAQSYGGSAEVVEPTKGYTCRIEFSVLANEADN